MKLSKYIFKSHKNETNLDKATDRLMRGCFIQKESSGIFRFTNLGLRVLEKIKKVIREEHDKYGCIEVALPILQDISLWEKSGRAEAYGKERFQLFDRHESKMVLAPTAEESATELISSVIDSYADLPVIVYQILEKYRDEMRPRFGLVRSRQFIMKDAYSFAKDEQEALKIYLDLVRIYKNIFNKLCIKTYVVPSDTGEIGGKYAHEFVVIDEKIGESLMYYDELTESANSIEDLLKLKCGFEEKGFTNKIKCLEIGNIFHLGTTYSESMNALFNDNEGVKKPFIMGCYGIGVTRILAYIASAFTFFPEIVSPFDYYIVGIDNDKSTQLYNSMISKGFDVLLDDRKQSAGVKFNDGDMIGIPKRITIGNNIEFKNFNCNTEIKFSSIEDLLNYLEEKEISSQKTY